MQRIAVVLMLVFAITIMPLPTYMGISMPPVFAQGDAGD